MKKIVMSGVIGWDVLPDNIRTNLEEANGDDVELVISSPGGLVADALEIFNMIRGYSGHVRAVLSGFAMSAASYIPLAADEVVAEDNAVFMIHNVHGGVWGDHNDILDYGAMCKGLSNMLTKAYAKFTGKDAGELASMMDSTTYFFGEEIVEAGFASSLVKTDSDVDEESAKASATLAFQDTTTKLSADQNALKKDLSRASALALGDINNGATDSIKPQVQKEITMDLKTLKEKHPDLVAAITDEATTGMADKIAAAKAEGAEAERDRIKAVHDQSFPGFEDIVNEAMFDGKSQAGDVAMSINKANFEALNKHKQDSSSDAPPVIDEPANDGTIKGSDSGKPQTEEQAKAKWEKEKAIRDEFFDFENYWAYVKENPSINVKRKGE